MNLADWLDKQEAANRDLSQIDIPRNLVFESEPDETIYFKEIRPCGMFCSKNHPFAKVQRYGHWYAATGQDKRAGIHSDAMRWRLFTKDRELACRTAKERIES